MPRKSKAALAAEKAAAERAARPFAVDSTDAYGAMPEDRKREVAEAIAQAKAAGASGDEMRARFGERLTGPQRRRILRAFGFSGPAYVAPSYDAYRDGELRSGTRHAREHGARAEERRAAAAAEQAAAEEAQAKAQAKRDAAKARRAAKKAAR